MQRTAASIRVVVLLMLLPMLGIAGPSTTVADGANHVVIISCLVDTSATPAEFRQIKIAGASSSTNAPNVPTGARTNCAQALAVLLTVGFEVINVEGSASGAIYTLRKRD